MNLINKIFSLFAAFVLLNFSIARGQTASYTPDVLERIASVESNLSGALIVEGDKPWSLKDRMTYHNIPAVSIAVVKDYKIDWLKAYGFADLIEKRLVNTSTRFQAASISKSINAMALLKLVQDKKIVINADINQYLSSWKFPYDSVAKGKKISLMNLLSHTGGLNVHGFRGYAAAEKIPTIVEILNGIPPANSAAVRSNAEPGVKSVYSGGGTTISQLLAIDVTGKPYQDFVREAVFKPLAMNESFHLQHATIGKTSDLSTAYRATGEEVAGKCHNYPEMAAAALWTNPADLARFIIEMQRSLIGRSNKILSTEMTKLMLSPYLDRSAGLGVFIERRGDMNYFSHGGANEGFRSIYYGSVEGGNGVVVMVNSDNGAIMQEIINSVAVVYKWKDFYKPKIKKLVSVPENIASTYVGKYEISPQFILYITNENGQLKGQATGVGKLELYAEAENKYFVKTADIQLEFVKSSTGVVDQLFIYQNGGKIPAKKIF